MARWLVAVVLLALLPASASAAPLAGTRWKVTKVGGHAVKGVYHERLAFPTRRRFTGHDACGNDFSGRYRATATRLRLRGVLTTGLGCDGGEPVPDIAGVVDRTRGYRMSGNRLELLGRHGHTIAVLKRR